MEKAVIGMMLAIVMMMVMAQVVQGMQPTQPTPPTQYTCPICGETFSTYDLLYSHFTTAHPAEPIDIIWE